MLEEIRELYEYNRWANRRFLDAVEQLSASEYSRDMGSSFPSVEATLAHILGAEWIWLQRWGGVSPAEFPREWDTSTAAALRTRWGAHEQDQRRFLDLLDEERLRSTVEYRNIAGTRFANPLWQLMRHVVNHSSYHRGQAATMLRQLGHPVPSTDLIVWFREHGRTAG